MPLAGDLWTDKYVRKAEESTLPATQPWSASP